MGLFSRLVASFWAPSSLSTFTPRSQQTLALARRVAASLGRDCVDIDHMLVGLLWLNQGVAVLALKKAGVDLQILKSEIEKGCPRGDMSIEAIRMPYDKSVKLCLALGMREMKSLSNSNFGTEHILLGIMRYGAGVAARELNIRGLTLISVREHVRDVKIEESKKGANQASVPTPASVTPAAGAPVAPDAGAAHL